MEMSTLLSIVRHSTGPVIDGLLVVNQRVMKLTKRTQELEKIAAQLTEQQTKLCSIILELLDILESSGELQLQAHRDYMDKLPL